MLAKHLRSHAAFIITTIIGMTALNSPAQTAPSTQPPGISVSTYSECCSTVDSDTPDPNHVVVTLDDSAALDFWMFRLDGVAGKTVRIDVKSTKDMKKWTTLNPVYAQALPIGDPELYVAGPSTGSIVGPNHATIATTDGQKWHYIVNTDFHDKSVFSMTQTFDSDSVWIASRVPHPPSYNEKFIRGLADSPLAKVVEVGKSQKNRPLLLVQIGGDDDAAKSRPCVVIAGGEQANQPDGMWAAQGAIEYLLGDDDTAKALRDKCRFLIIPDLDPDGTADSTQNLPMRFQPSAEIPESTAWANYFQKWVDDGNRLDAVFEIHSMQSHEAPHLSRAFIETRPPALAIDKVVQRKFAAAGLQFSPHTQTKVDPISRFSGYLTQFYGPLNIVYELNAQAPTRHLDLMQLKATGGMFAEAAGELLTGPEGASALAAVDSVRARRQKYWSADAANNPPDDAIASETTAHDAAGPDTGP